MYLADKQPHQETQTSHSNQTHITKIFFQSYESVSSRLISLLNKFHRLTRNQCRHREEANEACAPAIKSL